MRKIILFFLMLPIAVAGVGQTTIPLYGNEEIPNSKHADNEEKVVNDHNNKPISVAVQHPTLTVFLPKNPNGIGLLICPGGGYSIVAFTHEGEEVASQLSEWGFTVFVLKYRIPNIKWMQNPEIAPLQDVQQALITIRKNAAKWKIDPDKTGIMGFSAGGHLASTAATHFSTCLVANPDNISVRPDFQILVYPVISFTDNITHEGSRRQLLGENPSRQKIEEYSAEYNCTADTPPALFIHSSADESVSYLNSMVYYDALIKKGVRADLHIFSKGGHGFGTIKTGYPIDSWLEIIRDWLRTGL